MPTATGSAKNETEIADTTAESPVQATKPAAGKLHSVVGVVADDVYWTLRVNAMASRITMKEYVSRCLGEIKPIVPKDPSLLRGQG